MSDDPTEKLPEDAGQAILAELRSLREQFEQLDRKVEQRLMDTRPIWEAVQSQLAELKDGVERGFRGLNRKLEVLSSDVVDLRARQSDIENRMDRLEGNKN